MIKLIIDKRTNQIVSHVDGEIQVDPGHFDIIEMELTPAEIVAFERNDIANLNGNTIEFTENPIAVRMFTRSKLDAIGQRVGQSNMNPQEIQQTLKEIYDIINI